MSSGDKVVQLDGLINLNVADIPGVRAAWRETLGDRGICVAILDGPVDIGHPSLSRAELSCVDSLIPCGATQGSATEHGSFVTSVIFGQHDGPVKGIAPGCSGTIMPIFAPGRGVCSQLDLARALTAAAQCGAHVINISGGQFSPSGMASPLLAAVVRDCAERGVLIVAAAGNQGCECLNIPAVLPTVLAVGAMNSAGEPLDLSNWGWPYQLQGILAPGENVCGAAPGGGSALRTGTSYATAVVSGVAALLLSLQRQYGMKPDPSRVREALLSTALGCEHQPVIDCRRLLAGRLNITGAISYLRSRSTTMSQTSELPASCPTAIVAGPPVQPEVDAIRPSDGSAGGCSCKGSSAPQFVFALGQIDYDLVAEARLDSLVQKMANDDEDPDRSMAFDRKRMLAYLETNPWDAASIEWTLSLDGTPVYAIRPQGPFAAEVYKQLRRFLHERINEGAERVSIPGVLAGKATLMNGQVVPVIAPDLRGMYSWTTHLLVEAVVGAGPDANAGAEVHEGHERKKAGVRNFLDRVYDAVRNLGVRPQDRAINFAATNAYEIETVYESAMKEDMDLDELNVTPSPICRPGSDCWDVEMYFFYPQRQVQTVRKVYRFTVDVSDVVPVTVGSKRSWFTR